VKVADCLLSSGNANFLMRKAWANAIRQVITETVCDIIKTPGLCQAQHRDAS
jgi:hypothetical protein